MSRFDEMSGTMALSSGPECVSESADTSALGNMGGQTEAQMQFDPFGNASKSLRACRHLKRELLSQINNLHLALQRLMTTMILNYRTNLLIWNARWAALTII